MLIKLTFTGDTMCKKQQLIVSKKKDQYDFSSLFASMKENFENAYVIANLETPIAKKDRGYTKESFSFNTPKAYIEALKENGVNFVTTANNHCLDRGIEGLKETIDALDQVGIVHTGTYRTKEESNQIAVQDFQGFKIAFLSFTYGTNAMINQCYLDKNQYYVDLFRKQEKKYSKYRLIRGIKHRILDKLKPDFFSKKREQFYLKKLKEKIERAKKEADFIIMCMHSGGQYNKKVDSYTKKLSEFLIDSGVDTVVGNHPHVVLDSIFYKDKFIAYSLGNFITMPYANPNQIDDYPDYSILLHYYFDTEKKKLTEISFSVAKTILDINQSAQVVLTNELIKKLKGNEKEKIIEETKHIVNLFSKKKVEKLQAEYRIEGD